MKLPTERITSRQNALVMLAGSLAEKKYREREGLFRFDGTKLFAEALAADVPLVAVLLRESAAATVFAGDVRLPAACRAAVLTDAVFDRLSEEKSPEGVICLARRLDKIRKIVTINKRDEFFALFGEGKTLALESVRDPGNLGTAIRSARAFGIENVLLSADCADVYHPRAIRAAMGALFRQRVLIADDLPAVLALLRERGRVYAAALDETAARLGQTALAANDTVLVGNEGHGVSAAARGASTDTLYIPMTGGVESLNAGVAASVIAWEWAKDE